MQWLCPKSPLCQALIYLHIDLFIFIHYNPVNIFHKLLFFPMYSLSYIYKLCFLILSRLLLQFVLLK